MATPAHDPLPIQFMKVYVLYSERYDICTVHPTFEEARDCCTNTVEEKDIEATITPYNIWTQETPDVWLNGDWVIEYRDDKSPLMRYYFMNPNSGNEP